VAALLGLVALATGLGGETVTRIIIRNPELTPGVLALLGLGLMVAAGDALSILFGAMLRSLGVLRGPFVAQALGGLALLPLAAALAFGAGWHLKGLLVAQGGIALVRAAWLALMFDRAARERDRSVDTRERLHTATSHPSPGPGHRPVPITLGPEHRAP
jgi:Na+-driven multidrug efflux pump